MLRNVVWSLVLIVVAIAYKRMLVGGFEVFGFVDCPRNGERLAWNRDSVVFGRSERAGFSNDRRRPEPRA